MQNLSRFIRFQYKKLRRNDERVELMVFLRPKNIHSVSFGLWKMVSPSFRAITPNEPFEMLEIGSGSLATEYREIIRRNSVGLLEIPSDDGGKPTAVIPIGKVALQWVFAEALEHQVAGISRAMHVMLMYSEGVILKARSEEPEANFPSVATNWLELLANLKRSGISNMSAIATA